MRARFDTRIRSRGTSKQYKGGWGSNTKRNGEVTGAARGCPGARVSLFAAQFTILCEDEVV